MSVPVAQAADEPDQSSRTHLYGLVLGGGALQANNVGPSFLGGWTMEHRLASWFYVRGGPAISYSFSTEFSTSQFGPATFEVVNTDEQRILGLSLDQFLGLEVLDTLAIEFGGNLGIASNAAKSTFCGKETYVAGYVGLAAGLALRLGSHGQYFASLHGTAITLPVLRCSNWDPNDDGSGVTRRMYHERDFETVGALGRFGVYL